MSETKSLKTVLAPARRHQSVCKVPLTKTKVQTLVRCRTVCGQRSPVVVIEEYALDRLQSCQNPPKHMSFGAVEKDATLMYHANIDIHSTSLFYFHTGTPININKTKISPRHPPPPLTFTLSCPLAHFKNLKIPPGSGTVDRTEAVVKMTVLTVQWRESENKEDCIVFSMF